MNYRIILGDNIRGFRNNLGWTQEKLAARAKLTNDYISRVELGKDGISADTIVTIAKVFKIEPNILLIKDAYKKAK